MFSSEISAPRTFLKKFPSSLVPQMKKFKIRQEI